MSTLKAQELIGSAILLLDLLEKRIILDFNIREAHHKILDIKKVLFEVKEELKEYKL